MQPDVSVVIPTYNRLRFLKRAIQSCLSQNEGLDIELVVVDDGSTDGTRDWLHAMSVEHVRPVLQEHHGAQVARNRGFEESTGAFVKFLDDDDMLAEGALADEVAALRETGAFVSYGDMIFSKPGGRERVFEQGEAPDLASGIFEGVIKTHPFALLYRREALQGLRWDPSLRYHQDKAFALHVATRDFPSLRIDRVVGTHDEHDEKSITNDVKAGRSPVEILERRIESTHNAVSRLQSENKLKAYHRQAAASGLWTWAHMLSAYDLEAFDRCFAKIKALDPAFRPSRSSALLAALDEIGSPATTERLLYPLRLIKRKTVS